MKKILSLVILSFSIVLVNCQKSNFALGFIIGEPTGICAKFKVADNSAFDAALAWNIIEGSDAITLHADYLKHHYFLLDSTKFHAPLYFGIGTRAVLANEVNIAARIPVGLLYIFNDMPLDAFFEIVPIVTVLPSTKFDLDVAIGIRYYL